LEVLAPLFETVQHLVDAVAATRMCPNDPKITKALAVNPILVSYFSDFVSNTSCSENVMALNAMEDYHRLCEDEGDEGHGVPVPVLRNQAQLIIDTYFSDTAPTPIELPIGVFRQIQRDIGDGTAFIAERSPTLFRDACASLANDIKADVFLRFQNSSQCRTLLQQRDRSFVLRPNQVPVFELRKDVAWMRAVPPTPPSRSTGAQLAATASGAESAQWRTFLSTCDGETARSFYELLRKHQNVMALNAMDGQRHRQWLDALLIWDQITTFKAYLVQARSKRSGMSPEEEKKNRTFCSDFMYRLCKIPTCAVFRARVPEVDRTRFLQGIATPELNSFHLDGLQCICEGFIAEAFAELPEAFDMGEKAAEKKAATPKQQRLKPPPIKAVLSKIARGLGVGRQQAKEERETKSGDYGEEERLGAPSEPNIGGRGGLVGGRNVGRSDRSIRIERSGGSARSGWSSNGSCDDGTDEDDQTAPWMSSRLRELVELATQPVSGRRRRIVERTGICVQTLRVRMLCCVVLCVSTFVWCLGRWFELTISPNIVYLQGVRDQRDAVLRRGRPASLRHLRRRVGRMAAGVRRQPGASGRVGVGP
jgi:hypothetical protein